MSRVLTHVCEFEVCVTFEIRRKCHCSMISLLIPYLITRIFRTKTWVLVTPVNSSAKFWVYQVVMKLRKDVIQHGFLGKRYWVMPCSSQSSDTSFRIKQRENWDKRRADLVSGSCPSLPWVLRGSVWFLQMVTSVPCCSPACVANDPPGWGTILWGFILPGIQRSGVIQRFTSLTKNNLN